MKLQWQKATYLALHIPRLRQDWESASRELGKLKDRHLEQAVKYSRALEEQGKASTRERDLLRQVGHLVKPYAKETVDWRFQGMNVSYHQKLTELNRYWQLKFVKHKYNLLLRNSTEVKWVKDESLPFCHHIPQLVLTVETAVWLLQK